MTQLSPRAVLPATLVFLGIALACSLACYNGPSPTAAEFDEKSRRDLAQQIAALLPPLATTTAGRKADQLEITGDTRTGFQVTVAGDFTAAAAETFARRVRAVRSGGLLPRLILKIERGNPGTPVASYEIDPAGDVDRALRPFLPAATGPGREFIATLRVTANALGATDVYQINATGPFNADSAKVFCDHVREVRRTTPGQTRFVVRIFNLANRPSALVLTQVLVGGL